MELFKISFQSHPRWLKEIRSLVKEACVVSGCDEAQIKNLVLAVDEACTNVIKHSYKGRTDGEIILECLESSGDLEFILRDRGEPVDHDKIKCRSLEEIRPGGLGVYLIKNTMDRVDYSRSKGMNIVTMTKYAKA